MEKGLLPYIVILLKVVGISVLNIKAHFSQNETE